jgi:hypothetical protein
MLMVRRLYISFSYIMYKFSQYPRLSTVCRLTEKDMWKVLQLSLFGFLLSAVSSTAQFAPKEETVAANLPGQSIGGTQFLSATRFDWFGESGNWSYTRLSEDVGLITQTYDEPS